MYYIMGCVQYGNMYVLCYGLCAILSCYVIVGVGVAEVELFVSLWPSRQLQSPRQISLSGTIKFIVLYRIVSYRIVSQFY